MKQKFTIIGISDSREQYFSPELLQIISSGKVFSGGKRHHEIMAGHLPENSEWIDITVPLDNVFEAYEEYEEITVFASGDPLFFGFANTIKNRLPEAEIIVYPYFNSLQMLAHRFLLPYADAKIVSLTGREWKLFDTALIRGEKMIGILTDRHKTPAVIASRMLDYGYDNYRMYIGELIGNEKEERLREMSVGEAAVLTDIKFPNAVFLKMTGPRMHPLGIPESEFALLDGRAAMITKMPIRLLTLSMLGLEKRSSFWDIGFCTGSVSVEARLQFPHLDITSFEIRQEGRELMDTNSHKFGAPGIDYHICDFMSVDLKDYPAPDAVFIGGHNGQLVEMMERIYPVLKKDGVIVLNSVTEKSRILFEEGAAKTGLKIVQTTHITVDSHNPITILKAIK